MECACIVEFESNFLLFFLITSRVQSMTHTANTGPNKIVIIIIIFFKLHFASIFNDFIRIVIVNSFVL